MSKSSFRRVAVIGGGITGITAAYKRAKAGCAVMLFDKHPYPAMETSFANAGQLSASNAEVWNSWATVLKGSKWMFSPGAPLLVNPKPSWHKLSWMAEFIAAIPMHEQKTGAPSRPAAFAVSVRLNGDVSSSGAGRSWLRSNAIMQLVEQQ